jgi:hypothetical protein
MNPAKNGPVNIFKFLNHEIPPTVWNGYEIAMEVDMQDYTNNKYNAYLYTSTEVLIVMPVMSHGFMKENAAYDRIVAAVGPKPQCKLVRDTLRTKLSDNERLQKKYVLLKFDNLLTNEPFSPNASARNEQIEIEIIPVTTTFQFEGMAMNTTVGHISWRVGIVEQERRNASNVQAQTVAEKLASVIAGMRLS